MDKGGFFYMEKLAYKQILPYLPADRRDMLRRADQE